MMALHRQKFGELLPGNSRDDRTYLRTSGMTQPKTGVYSGISISRYTGPISQSVHHMKALYVQMMGMYLIFQFFRGRCNDNQIMLP